jgi:malonyl-CoA decarboxylase
LHLRGRDHSNVGVIGDGAKEQVTELVDRRARLLADRGAGDPQLDEVTEQLTALLAGAEPVVRRLRSDEPGVLLDTLAEREPVVPFGVGDRRSAELADRLDDDRRCFVLEHPLLPARPLNVVWVALCEGRPSELAPLLDLDAPSGDPHRADTAAFYSIWNVEPGLVGIPGGRSLLTGAIAELRAELPGLVDFLTLSPIPGFRRWLDRSAAPDLDLSDDAGELDDRVRPALLRLAAQYLTTLDEHGRPLDPVARFHLGNGARLLHLNWRADMSPRGWDRSYGVMANYHYEPEDRDANREQLEQGRPAVGPAIDDLLRAEPSSIGD